MGRIYESLIVRGKPRHCLFDSGAQNTYIVAEVARDLPRWKMTVPFRSALGGRVRRIKEMCGLSARLQGRPIETDAFILQKLGADEKGRPIEVLFGALAMQRWGIGLVPKEERLDLTHYPKEFVEF